MIRNLKPQCLSKFSALRTVDIIMTKIKDHPVKNGNRWWNFVWKETSLNVWFVKVIAISFVIILSFFLSVEATSQKTLRLSAKNATKKSIDSISYIQDNSVIASTPPYFLEHYVLGSLGEAIIHCESRGDQSRIGALGEIGIAQFMPTTWEWMTDLAGYHGDINNEEDQKYMLAWGLANGYEMHWTCFRILTGR